MTIYALKVTDKKGDEIPEVVTDGMLLVENEKNESSEPKQAVVVTAISGPVRKRHPVKNVFVFLLGLILMIVLIVGCIALYKHLVSTVEVKHPEVYQGRCGVRYHGLQDTDAIDGEFEEQVEIDEEFEKLFVPAIGDTRNATIFHDFNVNLTAIIDKENGYCYIMNLNRSLVLPPRDFLDLLIKLKKGYYIPDAEVLQENYRAVTPPIQDLTPFGIYIEEECSKLDTYRLVKMGEPASMSKRSVSIYQSDKYCLGEAGKKKLMCFKIYRYL